VDEDKKKEASSDAPNLGGINLDDIDLDNINLDEINLDDLNLDDIDGDEFNLDLNALSSQLDEFNQNNPAEKDEFNIDLEELSSQLSELNLDGAEGLEGLDLNLEELTGSGDFDDPEFQTETSIPDDIAAQFFSSPAASMAMAAADSDNPLDLLINEALSREAATEFDEKSLSLGEEALSVDRPAAIYDGKNAAPVDMSALDALKESKRKLPLIVNLLLGLPSKYMYAALGVIVIMLTTTSIFGYTLLFGAESRRRSFERDGGIYLVQSHGSANSAHQIFIDNRVIQLGDIEFEIISATFDSEKSVFNFSNPIDQSYLNFFIREDNGILRYVDLRTIVLDVPSNSLHMQALTSGIRDFTLIAADTTTGEQTSVDFRFSQNLVHPLALHAGNRIHLNFEYAPFSVFLDDSTFSPASTFISYSIVNDVPYLDPYATYGFSPSLSLREGVSAVRTISEETTSFNYGRVILGTVNTQPLRSLLQPIELTFNGLNRQYPLNIEMPVAPLLSRVEPPTLIPLDYRHSIFIEGMAHSIRDNLFVLVFNTQNQMIPLPYEAEDLLEFMESYRYDFRSEFAAMNAFFRRERIDPYFNRVETIMTAYILVDTPLGQARVPGRALHGRQGSDVLFDLSDFGASVTGSPLSNISLLIESVELVREPDVNSLEMSRLSTSPNLFNEIFFTDIIEQFVDRLRYKSGEISRTQLGSFDERVFVNPADFQRIYTQDASASGEAMFNAQVLAGTVHNNRLYAIVREMWQSGPLDPLSNHLLTYKVYAEQDSNGRWIITRNEVISGS